MTTIETPTPPTNRSTLRTVLLVGGSIVIALVLVFTTLRIVAAATREDTSGTHRIDDSFSSMTIDTTAADVTIRVADVDEAELVYEQANSNQRLRYNVRGETLVVSVGNSFWDWGGFGGWLWEQDSRATLTVTLPADAAGTIDLDTTAGDVELGGDFGDLTITTTAGNLTLLGSARDVSIDTTAGDVRLDGFAVQGTLSTTSTAGELNYELSSLPKLIDIETTAGDVLLVLPDGSYRIDTSSTAGSINTSAVSSDASSDRIYRVETTAGDIEVRQR